MVRDDGSEARETMGAANGNQAVGVQLRSGACMSAFARLLSIPLSPSLSVSACVFLSLSGSIHTL